MQCFLGLVPSFCMALHPSFRSQPKGRWFKSTPRNQRNHTVTGNLAFVVTAKAVQIRELTTVPFYYEPRLAHSFPFRGPVRRSADWLFASPLLKRCRTDPSSLRCERAASASAGLPSVLPFRPATRGRCDETYEIQSCRVQASRRPEPGGRPELSRRGTDVRLLDSERPTVVPSVRRVLATPSEQ